MNTPARSTPRLRALRAVALLPSLLAAACADVPITTYQSAQPAFDPYTFFAGHTRAWGVVQDWRGRVLRRFEVDIDGAVSPEQELVLEERFRYADGERSTRTWHIRRQPDGTLSGGASDIVGPASGATSGNAMRWRYVMDLDTGGTRYRVSFDDWIWQLDESTLVNRSYIRKLGITVAEVTIFMRKSAG